jgi:acyl carrier protein
MRLVFSEVFDTVRSVLSREARIPLEEITLESHVYLDLCLGSLAIVELFLRLEQEFNLPIPDKSKWADLVGLEKNPNQEEVDELMWRVYRVSLTTSMRKYLEGLNFSEDIITRATEIEEFCQLYGVQPFTVGCICACIVDIAQTV